MSGAERQREYMDRLRCAAASNSPHSAKAAAAAVNDGTCSNASSPHSAYALVLAQNEPLTDEAGAKLTQLAQIRPSTTGKSML